MRTTIENHRVDAFALAQCARTQVVVASLSLPDGIPNQTPRSLSSRASHTHTHANIVANTPQRYRLFRIRLSLAYDAPEWG